jgi:LPS sulfotransferase NodH
MHVPMNPHTHIVTHAHIHKHPHIHQIVAVPEAQVLHPYWSNPIKQVRGWAEGDVLCLEALSHMTFYATPNWAERVCMINAYAVIRSVYSGVQMFSDGSPPSDLVRACSEVMPVWLWAAQVSLVVVLVEVAMRVAVHYPNALRRAGLPTSASALGGCSISVLVHMPETDRAGGVCNLYTSPCMHAYLLAVSGLAVLPEACQDATRLFSKLRRLKLNQVCMCLDWMDGQNEHVTAVRVERFVKNVTCVTVLGVLDPRLPLLLRGVLVLTLLPVASLWVLQTNNRAVVGGRPRRCNLLAEPLPLNMQEPHACADKQLCAAQTHDQQSLGVLGLAWWQQWLARVYGQKTTEPVASCKTSAVTQPEAESVSIPTSFLPGSFLPGSFLAAPFPPQCRPFVVLTHQRTGSNLLCGLLHHHPDIAMHNELFHDQKIHTYGWKDHTWTPSLRDRTPVAFLTDVLSGSGCYRKSGRAPKAVGFKLLPEHWHRSEVAHEAFERLLLDERVLKVVLKRENRLHTCVSAMRVGIKGVYISEQHDYIRVHIRPDEFQGFCVNYEACFEYYTRVLQGQKFITVSYEDLADADTQKECVSSVLEFLGVDTEAELQKNPACTRQSNGDMRSAIVNYAELEYAFRHTKYAKDFK